MHRCLLYFHIGSDLVERHMSRSLDHNLYIVRPCALGQFTETDKLLDLADIGGVCQTSRTAGISERNGDIMLLADIKNFIKIFIERVLILRSCSSRQIQDFRRG